MTNTTVFPAPASVQTNAIVAAQTNPVASALTNAVADSPAISTNLFVKPGAVATNVPGDSAKLATKATASVGVPPPSKQSEPSAGGGSSWTLPVLAVTITVVVIAVVAALLWKRATPPLPPTGPGPQTPPPIPSREQRKIAADVLAAVAPDARNSEALLAELAAVLAGSGKLSDPSLASILRIEESFEKTAESKYLRRVSVLRRKDGTTGTLAKVESEIGWEYVPDAVRGEFIRTRQDKVARLVYDAGKADRR